MTPAGSVAERVRPLLRTRQVRQFTDAPVSPEALAALADVARWSGSSRNEQPWRFIVITDVGVLRRIGEAGMPITRALATAPAAIAIVLPTDPSREVQDAYDDGRAAERLLIGATLLELAAGIVWVRPEARPVVAELLGLPGDRFVRTIVAVGHASEAGLRPKSAPGAARLPREQAVFAERWRPTEPRPDGGGPRLGGDGRGGRIRTGGLVLPKHAR
jgi:nitroreductase